MLLNFWATCQATTRQIKSGTNHSGSPRCHCKHCRRTYTPSSKPHGYDPALRHQALTFYLEAANFRRIARHPKVYHQTVVNWIDAAARLPSPPTPSEAHHSVLNQVRVVRASRLVPSLALG